MHKGLLTFLKVGNPFLFNPLSAAKSAKRIYRLSTLKPLSTYILLNNC